MFIYRRKRAIWLSLHRLISMRITHPIRFEQSYLTRKLEIGNSTVATESSEQIVKNVNLAIKVVPRNSCSRFWIRFGAFMSVLFSLFLLYNETMLFFGNAGSAIAAFDTRARDKIWVIFLGTVFMLVLTVFAAFMTIFNLKFSDYLQLVPKLTDPVTFCSFTSLFSKVIAVTCFNFMVMAGEVQLKIDQLNGIENEDIDFQTSFTKFYSSMIETPFLGDKYNYVLPGLMLVFSILFILLSYLKYENRIVSMMRRFNDRQDNIISHQSAEPDASIVESARNTIAEETKKKTGKAEKPISD